MKRPAAKTAADGALRLRRMGIDTYRENVAYLHRACALYHAAGFQALTKVQVSAGSRRILAVLNVADDSGVVRPNQLGLSEQAFAQLGLHLEVIITDGRQPVGRGIGPVFETRDVMQVLQGDPNAPADLRQKALRLAGRVIEFDPDVRGGEAYAIARDILDSGRALAKMNAIIDAQGRQKKRFAPGQLTFEMRSAASGTITSIDNLRVARVARFAGAPLVKGAGVDLFRQVGDKVKKGEPLYRVHAEVAADFRFARSLAARASGYTIGRADEVPAAVVEP